MKPVQKTTFLENHKLNRDIQMLENNHTVIPIEIPLIFI